MIDSDDYMTKFCLRKVSEFWGVQKPSSEQMPPSQLTSSKNTLEDNNKPTRVSPIANVPEGGFVYYMIAPRWVHKANPILYLMQLSTDDSNEA